MSLAEAQQIYNMLQEIERLLDNIESQGTQKLTRVATQTVYVQQALTKTLTLLRRMGLPENVDRAVVFIQRVISIATQLRMVIIALNAAIAGTPGGWLLAGLGALMVAMDVGDLMMSS